MNAKWPLLVIFVLLAASASAVTYYISEEQGQVLESAQPFIRQDSRKAAVQTAETEDSLSDYATWRRHLLKEDLLDWDVDHYDYMPVYDWYYPDRSPYYKYYYPDGDYYPDEDYPYRYSRYRLYTNGELSDYLAYKHYSLRCTQECRDRHMRFRNETQRVCTRVCKDPLWI